MINTAKTALKQHTMVTGLWLKPLEAGQMR